jgi:hypothetical protein
VPENLEGPPVPPAFAAALVAVRHARIRPELTMGEIATPGHLAPWSIALGADVNAPGTAPGSPDRTYESLLGTGRFVLLHDPSEPEAWGGAFRVVCFAQAPLETDIGVDPFLADVAWSWLVDALDIHDAEYIAASGTATKILSTGFGELAEQGDGAQIELRASWTPVGNEVGAHVEGWSELLCMLAGLPPAIEGVSLLSSRRAGRE